MSDEIKPWWEEQQDILGQELVKAAQAIESAPNEYTRQDLNLIHARMFENAPVPSLYHFGGSTASGVSPSFAWSWVDRSTENVLRSVIMTAFSQICRNRPRARFLTNDGNWKQKRKAKKLTQFCDGIANETKMYAVTRRAWVDASVFDCGAVQVVKDDGRIRLDRVLPNEILIEQNDGIYAKPKTIYRRRYMDRAIVLKKFGKTPVQQGAIKNVPAVNLLGLNGPPSNLIPVYESWHLGPKADGKGGKHAIAVKGDGGTLFVEDWDKPYFPIVFLLWEDALGGPFGRSLAEQLAPMQYDFDKLTVRIEKAIRLFATPRLGIPRGAKIVKNKITNEEGSMIEFGDKPPVPLVWPALTPDVYQERDRRRQSMYDIAGVSRNAAAGQKESGVTSGEAIRESIDIQQARMAVSEQRWEQFHVELFTVMVDFARDIGSEKGFTVNTPGKRFLDTIDWKDVNLAADEYVLDVFPTSYLPITPQGRLSTIQDLVTSGIWSVEKATRALDDLDVEREMSLDDAAEHYLEKQLDGMLYEGKAAHPDEFTPMQRAIELCAQYVNQGEAEEAPDKNIELVRRYIEELKINSGAGNPAMTPPPAPGPQPAPGAQPGGAPAPQPVPMAA